MILILPGDPIAKARPRLSRWGTYDPQDQLKKRIKKQIYDQFKKLQEHEDVKIENKASNLPCVQFYQVDLIFCMPIPKNASKSKKNMLAWNCIDNDSNKDCDNLSKFYLDCAQDVLFSNDRYVVNLSAKRISSENPKTIFIMKKRKSLSDEVCGILGIFSRNEMSSLLQDLEDIYMLYDVDPKDDWVLDAVGEEDEREVRLSRTAYLLSKLSDYADQLKQIKRNFGGFHQRCKAALPELIDG